MEDFEVPETHDIFLAAVFLGMKRALGESHEGLMRMGFLVFCAYSAQLAREAQEQEHEAKTAEWKRDAYKWRDGAR